jgi:hypothetical protein
MLWEAAPDQLTMEAKLALIEHYAATVARDRDEGKMQRGA